MIDLTYLINNTERAEALSKINRLKTKFNKFCDSSPNVDATHGTLSDLKKIPELEYFQLAQSVMTELLDADHTLHVVEKISIAMLSFNCIILNIYNTVKQNRCIKCQFCASARSFSHF